MNMMAGALKAHLWTRAADDHYVEPPWVDARLFEEEPFEGEILDPACGFGHIVAAARRRGHAAFGTDIAWRADGYVAGLDFLADFPGCARRDGAARLNIVSNPPFRLFRAFAERALALADGKVAMLWQPGRLTAAHWLRATPLQRVWHVTPRPSMPPGAVYQALIETGGKPKGGRGDYCWLVWETGGAFEGRVRWLHRDEGAVPREAGQ
jgi:SAM-dependent methyltransferase